MTPPGRFVLAAGRRHQFLNLAICADKQQSNELRLLAVLQLELRKSVGGVMVRISPQGKAA